MYHTKQRLLFITVFFSYLIVALLVDKLYIISHCLFFYIKYLIMFEHPC